MDNKLHQTTVTIDGKDYTYEDLLGHNEPGAIKELHQRILSKKAKPSTEGEPDGDAPDASQVEQLLFGGKK